MKYEYFWRIEKWLPERRNQACRILAVGRGFKCLVEFEDGYRVVTSGNFIRKLPRAGVGQNWCLVFSAGLVGCWSSMLVSLLLVSGSERDAPRATLALPVASVAFFVSREWLCRKRWKTGI